MLRHFLKDSDLNSAEQLEILNRALILKKDRFKYRSLMGPKTVAIIFDKSSTRTRVSFTTGVSELSGHPLVLEAASSQMGRGESIADTTKVLSSMVSMLVWRTFGQERLVEMAENASVPVINALTDQFHPCQVLADLAAYGHLRGGFESSGPALKGQILTYCGDGSNNMAHSYLLGGVIAGMEVRIAAPKSHFPNPAVVAEATALAAETGAEVIVTDDIKAAANSAQLIATDTWISMGEQANSKDENVFRPYQVTESIMKLGADAVFMHCLPAYRGKEVSAAVIDGPSSAVWLEAEYRLHAQKALMSWLIEKFDEEGGSRD